MSVAQRGGKMWNSIVAAFILLIVSALVLLSANFTLDKVHAGEWGFVALGATVTLILFGILVFAEHTMKDVDEMVYKLKSTMEYYRFRYFTLKDELTEKEFDRLKDELTNLLKKSS